MDGSCYKKFSKVSEKAGCENAIFAKILPLLGRQVNKMLTCCGCFYFLGICSYFLGNKIHVHKLNLTNYL